MKTGLMMMAALSILLLGCRTNESPEGQINDLEITAQIKSKLASDAGLSTATNVSVNSTNGVVTLSGQVNSAELKAKAEVIAKSIPKVVRVVNSIQIATKPQGSSSRSPFRRTHTPMRFGLPA